MINAAVMWSSSAIDVVDGTIPPADIICQDDSGNVVMSGDSFPVGTTTVTCRAKDTALNEGSGQFTITVEGRYYLFDAADCLNFTLQILAGGTHVL